MARQRNETLVSLHLKPLPRFSFKGKPLHAPRNAAQTSANIHTCNLWYGPQHAAVPLVANFSLFLWFPVLHFAVRFLSPFLPALCNQLCCTKHTPLDSLCVTLWMNFIYLGALWLSPKKPRITLTFPKLPFPNTRRKVKSLIPSLLAELSLTLLPSFRLPFPWCLKVDLETSFCGRK